MFLYILAIVMIYQVVVEQVDLDQVVLVQEYLQVVQLIQVVEQVELEKAHQDNQMVVQVSWSQERLQVQE